MTTAVIEELQAHFREFETVTLRRLPLYRYLAGRIADDPEVAGRLLLAPPERRWTTLLLAAVHDRVLHALEASGGDVAAAIALEPLAAWYPSVTGVGAARAVGSGVHDPWPDFRRLALEDRSVAESIAVRGTQTNEIGRSATTVLALGTIDVRVHMPLGLVEVGSSGGLNLRLDEFDYRYRPDDQRTEVTTDAGRAGGVHHLRGSGRGPILTSCWRGPNPPPTPEHMPRVGSRIGIDLEPLDLADGDDARWLVACQWPEQPERLERCRRAVDIVRQDPPTVVRGDLVERVAGLVAAVPADQHPVVLSTWCLAYLEPADQRAFLHELDRAGAERDLTLIYQEQPVAVPGLEPPDRPDGVTDHRPTALCRQDWRGGRRRPATRLADQHPHGTWVHWHRVESSMRFGHRSVRS